MNYEAVLKIISELRPGNRIRLADQQGLQKFHFQIKMPYSQQDRGNIACLHTKENFDGTFIHLYTTKGNEEEFRDLEAKKPDTEAEVIQMDVLDYIEAKEYVDKDGKSGVELK